MNMRYATLTSFIGIALATTAVAQTIYRPSPETIKNLRMPPVPADVDAKKTNFGIDPNVINTPIGTTAEVTMTINGVGRVKMPGGVCIVPTGKTSMMCTRKMAEGIPATIEAIGKEGNILTAWAGGCSGSAVKCTVMPKGKMQIAATFGKPPVQQMTTIKVNIPDGAGSVKASSLTPGASALSCSKTTSGAATGTCSIKVPLGSEVALIATPDPGSNFNGWESEQPGCAGFECAFGAQDPVVLNARFGSKATTHKLSIIRQAGYGFALIVNGNPAQKFDCTPKTPPQLTQAAPTYVLTCSADVPAGAVVDLSGYWIAGFGAGATTPLTEKMWAGECYSKTGGVCRILMTGPRTVLATWN